MEDSKRNTVPSSPILSPSGNNENESENQRNSQQKSKNFMSPTISTASKIISPKKKVLAKWKSPNLEPKSSFCKVGASISFSSIDSLTKVPAFSSPENNMVKSFEFDEEESFVPESSTVPYDPLTNYLSPRPKFLRYNPNRKRKILLSKVEKTGNSSLSPSVSFDSEISSSLGSSLKKEENLGNKQKLEQVTGEEDEEEEEEEEMIEGRGCGLKWFLLKGLIVFSALVFCIMYISSMNSPIAYNPDCLRPNFHNFTFTVDFENIGCINYSPFSLRNLDFGLEFDVREKLEMGLSKIAEFGVDKKGSTAEVQKIEIPKEIVGNLDCGQEENQVPTYPQALPIPEEACAELERAMVKGDWYYDDFPEPVVESFEERNTENEAQIADPDSNLVALEEYVVDSEDRMNDFVSNSDDGDLASEAENVAQDSLNDMKLENKGENSSNDKLHDFKLKSDEGDLANEVELEIVADDSLNVIEQENKGDYETEVAKSEPKFVEVQLVTEAKNVAVSQVNSNSEVNVDEGDHKQVSGTLKDLVWFVALTVMTYVTYLVVNVYHKCKNTFSKTTSSRKKSNFQVGKEEKNRIVGLPPKVGERLDQIHPQPDLQVNSSPSSVMIEAGLDQIHPKQEVQVNSSPTSFMIGSREERKKTPPRIIPKVKQLGEVEFSKEFSGSVGSSVVRSGMKMQGKEDSVFVVLDERSGKRSKVSNSSAESFSYSTNISKEKTAKAEGSKEEETSTLRRSRRIRSRIVAST